MKKYGSAITANDDIIFSPPYTDLWVGGEGDLCISLESANTENVILYNVASGTVLTNYRIDRVLANNTTRS